MSEENGVLIAEEGFDLEPRSEIEQVRDALRDLIDEVVEVRRLVMHIQCAFETSMQDNGNGSAAKSVQELVQQEPDSLTIGTPGNGQIKIFGDARKPEVLKRKIDTMVHLEDYAKTRKRSGGGW